TNATTTDIPTNSTDTYTNATTTDIPTNSTDTYTNATTTDISTNSTETEPIIIPNATESWQFDTYVNGSNFIGDVNVDYEGINGTSLEFEGEGYFLDNINSTQFSNVTITAWIKPNYTKGSSQLTVLNQENAFSLTINNVLLPKHIATFSVFDGIQWHSVQSNSTIGENWSHIAATYDGTNITIYLNGTLNSTNLIKKDSIELVTKVFESSTDYESSIDSLQGKSNQVSIGATLDNKRNANDSEKKFSGSIDDVRIYDIVLTAQQIYEIYIRSLPMIITVDEIVNEEPEEIELEDIESVNLIKNIVDTNYTESSIANITNNTIDVLVLNNTEDYIIIEEETLNEEVNKVTISSWVQPHYEDASTKLTIVSKQNSFELSINNIIEPKYVPTFSVFDGIAWNTIAGSTIIDKDGWSHISAVINQTSISLYVNGTLEASQTLSGTFAIQDGKIEITPANVAATKTDVVIGAYVDNTRGELQTSNRFSGFIDDVLIYREALTEDQIIEIYNDYLTDEIVGPKAPHFFEYILGISDELRLIFHSSESKDVEESTIPNGLGISDSIVLILNSKTPDAKNLLGIADSIVLILNSKNPDAKSFLGISDNLEIKLHEAPKELFESISISDKITTIINYSYPHNFANLGIDDKLKLSVHWNDPRPLEYFGITDSVSVRVTPSMYSHLEELKQQIPDLELHIESIYDQFLDLDYENFTESDKQQTLLLEFQLEVLEKEIDRIHNEILELDYKSETYSEDAEFLSLQVQQAHIELQEIEDKLALIFSTYITFVSYTERLGFSDQVRLEVNDNAQNGIPILKDPNIVLDERGIDYHKIEFKNRTGIATFGLPEWVLDPETGEYVDHLVDETEDKIIVESLQVPFSFDKQDCSITLYEKGLLSENPNLRETIQKHYWKVQEAYEGTDQWMESYQNAINCEVSTIQNSTGLFINALREDEEGKFLTVYGKKIDEPLEVFLYYTNKNPDKKNTKFGFVSVLEGIQADEIDLEDEKLTTTDLNKEIKEAIKNLRKLLKGKLSDTDESKELRKLAINEKIEKLKSHLKSEKLKLKAENGKSLTYDFSKAMKEFSKLQVEKKNGKLKTTVEYLETDVLEPGETAFLDPTFGFTSGSQRTANALQTGVGGSTCPSPSGITEDAGSPHEVRVDKTGFGISKGCKRTSAEWDISTIPEAIPTKVSVRYDVGTATNQRNIDWISFENKPIDYTTAQALWDDIANGTTFVSNNVPGSALSTNNVVVLGSTEGSSAALDVKDNLDEDWWAVGIKTTS
ncbi:MAG: LamG-like jellyroll fold domain-containing protein, partial [Nitrosopumilaceae archaeon]